MKKNTPKKAAVIAAIVIGFLLLIVAVAFMCLHMVLNRIDKTPDGEVTRIDPRDQFFDTDPVETDDNGSEARDTLPVIKPDDVTRETVKPITNKKLINILLVGEDSDGTYGGRRRSDTMLLCSINPETKKVSVISFLRDIYVHIPGGYADNRLNTAYAFGGFPLLTETFSVNFGITIDGCFEVNFEGFQTVIDILGGVDVKLTAAEAQIVEVGWEEKTYHLNGAAALSYVRIRKLDSDFGRTSRQRTVLNAIFQKFRNSDAKTLMNLFEKILPYLSTNMTNTQIMQLASQCIPMVTAMELNTYCVPAQGSFYYASIRGMSVIVPDLGKIRTQLEHEYLPIN